MEKQRLGNADLNVGPLGFGGAGLSGEGAGYGFGTIKDEQKLISHAFDRGIRVFDTAPIYGFGRSEEVLGKALKHLDREELTLITKGGIDWHGNKRVDLNNHPDVIEKMFYESLKRLNTEYIDIYFIHWPDKRHDTRFALEVLKRFQEQGKIKYIGLSNTNSEELDKAKEVCKVDVLQGELNIWSNSFEDLEERIRVEELGVTSWGSLDKGILVGTVKPGRKYDEYDARGRAPWWNEEDVKEKCRKLAEVQKKFDLKDSDLLSLCASFGKYSFSHVNLWGFKTTAQVDNALEAFENPLEKKLVDEVALCLQ